jgi:5-methylcytosine-specific restriction protein A
VFAIITENDLSQWDDKTAESYHFPNKYQKLLGPGTVVIYYKGRIRDKRFLPYRLSSDPHYFGTAIVDKITQDPNTPKNLFAHLKDFRPFGSAIPIRRANGETYEEIPVSRMANHWRDGVRLLTETAYSSICEAAGSPRPRKKVELSLNGEIESKSGLTSLELKNRLSKAPKKPNRILTTSIAFVRNADVVIAALRRASGHCELCLKAAPFSRPNGIPFLEVHHIVPLSEDGDDTIENAAALCPNCHRECHFGDDRLLRREKLAAMASDKFW